MRFVLFIIAALFVANITYATFIAPPAGPAPWPKVVSNKATMMGQDAWMDYERHDAPYRDIVRSEILKTLDAPWSQYCSKEGHRVLLAEVNGYYRDRAGLARNYGEVYGEAARQFAVKAWSTPDDHRIERLIAERLANGYLTAAELDPDAKRALATDIKQARAGASRCAG